MGKTSLDSISYEMGLMSPKRNLVKNYDYSGVDVLAVRLQVSTIGIRINNIPSPCGATVSPPNFRK